MCKPRAVEAAAAAAAVAAATAPGPEMVEQRGPGRPRSDGENVFAGQSKIYAYMSPNKCSGMRSPLQEENSVAHHEVKCQGKPLAGIYRKREEKRSAGNAIRSSVKSDEHKIKDARRGPLAPFPNQKSEAAEPPKTPTPSCDSTNTVVAKQGLKKPLKGKQAPRKKSQGKTQQNRKLTDFYPVRRSSRKSKAELQSEEKKKIDELIESGKEEGMKIDLIDGKGRGVIATKQFSRGDFVVEYHGDLIEITDAKKREALYAPGPSLSPTGLWRHRAPARGESMEPGTVSSDGGDRPAAPSGLSASQRRAELRRRKLLMNSEQRINRIMGFHRPGSGAEEENQTKSKSQDSDKLNSLSVPSVSKRVVLGDSVSGGTTDQPSGVAEVKGTQLGDKLDSFIQPPECSSNDGVELRQRSRGDPTAGTAQRASHHGLEQYLSRFEEAMKLRKQLISEKPSQEDGSTAEEFDSFRIFRLVGCALLALGVRAFVCKYLSIFAPFLTLQLAYMGLYKYFPKGEKKAKTTVLAAALLLSGIPAEVISRSMETYSKMGEVFTDLCVYFFTFIFCHELLDYWGSEVP